MGMPEVPEIPVSMRGRLPAPFPCPWCGGADVVVQGDAAAHWLRCATPACQACGPGAGTPTEALVRWHPRERRVHIRPVRPAVKER